MNGQSERQRHVERLTRPSPALMSFFDLYLPRYVRRHFHSFLIAHAARFAQADAPLIVYLNHASWWDPLTAWLLARRYVRGGENYAPMDAAALGRYGILRHLGLFPVEQGTRHGAAQFLRAASRILAPQENAAPRANLWITPQGCFTDARQRPLTFRPGLAALAARVPGVVALPLAIEYTYWDERLPEILVNVGEPVRFGEGGAENADALLTGALERTQDELALLALTRDAGRFEPVLRGKAGVSAVYDVWRRLVARARGEAYDAEHGSIH